MFFLRRAFDMTITDQTTNEVMRLFRPLTCQVNYLHFFSDFDEVHILRYFQNSFAKIEHFVTGLLLLRPLPTLHSGENISLENDIVG